MSAAAAWSYTATATLWARTGRADWSGSETFAPPVTFACDYAAKSKRMTDAKGDEFVTQLVIYTERAGVRQGDRVLIGASTAADPVAAGASEVRAVMRSADTLDRVADDYEIGA